MKVVFASGGTGGHLLPAQQLADHLEGVDVLFAGHHLSRKSFFERGRYRFVDVESSPRNPWVIVRGVWQALRLFWRERPDRVVGFGSYHSLPVLLAALALRIPIVLYEPNCKIGKVNRMLAPFAKTIAMQHPPRRILKHAQFVPLFPWQSRRALPDQRAARGRYGLEPDVPTVLVFGGSQGAQFLNCAMPEAIKGTPFQVLHIRGHGGVVPQYEARARVIEYERDMIWAYAAADVVVSRAGAATLSELILYERPALLIPFFGASGHQEENARFLVSTGGAGMLRQSEATPDKIRQWLLSAQFAPMRACLQRHRQMRQERSWKEVIGCITS